MVEAAVPGSPADGVLEPGDVLVRVDGKIVSHFLTLSEILDDSVGRQLQLELERGGSPLHVRLPVTDLHSVTPRRCVGGGGVLFKPSIQNLLELKPKSKFPALQRSSIRLIYMYI